MSLQGFVEFELHRPGCEAVLTVDLVDRAGRPTHDALERVLARFRERLLTGQAS